MNRLMIIVVWMGILSGFWGVGEACAVVFQVPGDFATIQGAIDAAAESGDEIVVAAGTYNEVINFSGKAVHLHSASGDPADTIIDGTGLNDSVVLCISGEGAGTILEGFTITGGTGNNLLDAVFTVGGGMFNNGSSPMVINCIFSGNSADSVGGMFNFISSSTVINCKFVGNTATMFAAGGMANISGSPTVMSCIFSGNSAQGAGGGMFNDLSNPVVTNCTFSGNTANFEGGGMVNAGIGHPVVTNCTFTRNVASNGGGIYSQSFSTLVTNCIFWRNLPNEIAKTENSIFVVAFSVVQLNLNINIIDGGGNINANPAFVDEGGPDNIPGTLDDDLRLQRFSPAIDAGDNTAAGLAKINFDGEGNPRFIDDAGVADTGFGFAPLVDMGALERQTVSIPITVQVPGDCPTIQGAIDAVAVNGDEIVVTPGTYHEIINLSGKAVHLRSASGDPADTIIDGTGLNDSVVICNNWESAGTILDGFTITGGTGHQFFGNRDGGGIYIFHSNPTVINCIITGNSAVKGGGMYNIQSSPTVMNCIIRGNSSDKGGGMYNIHSNPTVMNCFLIENSVEGNGGGMFNKSSSPTVLNCLFGGNIASLLGGGIYNLNSSSPTLNNCTFSGNSAHVGAGMLNESSSSPLVTNCTISGNSAGLSAGGIYNSNISNPIVSNCILWANSPDEMFNATSNPLISFSNVQGGLPAGTIDGGGNINSDPLFVDALGPDLLPGTADDDLRLRPGSPCIDAGINNGVPEDLADVDADGCTVERIPLDLDGNPRFRDDPATVNTGCGVPILGTAALVDMGVYEFPGTPAATVLIGDTNGNGLVNIDDLVAVLSAFGFSSGCSNADINGDGVVGMLDLQALLDAFGGCP